jgi:hypothetical protein
MKKSDWLLRIGTAIGITGAVLAVTGIYTGKDKLWIAGMLCFPASIVTSMTSIPAATREFRDELREEFNERR